MISRVDMSAIPQLLDLLLRELSDPRANFEPQHGSLREVRRQRDEHAAERTSDISDFDSLRGFREPIDGQGMEIGRASGVSIVVFC